MAKQIVNIGSSVNKGDGDPLRTAFDKINDNFDELYAATTLDLDSIGSNMIPTTDGTFALGSATKQWSDLYVKDFIYIGGTRLESDAAGNIVVSGGSLQIKDVQGDIFADDSTKVFDSATQTFTGKFEGDLVGTVAADDSTVMIDGPAGTINASALTGALPAIDGSALTGISASSIAFSNITSTPTTLSGYGITDAVALTGLSVSTASAGSAALSYNNLTGAFTFTPPDLSSYLTSYTETDPVVGAITGIVKADGAGNISAAVAGTDYLASVAFSDLTSTPTTIAGYGITDAVADFADLGTTPTTLAGYGITDALSSGGNITLGGDLDVGGNSIVSASNGAINIAPDGSGTIDLSGQVKFAEGMIEKFATTNGATGVTALDCSTGNVHYLTAPAGDITANFTNLNLTAEYATNVTVIIDQGGTEREITAVQIGGVAQTIVWQGNSAPTGTANGVDSFSFTILNDGGTYVVLGQMVAFGGV